MKRTKKLIAWLLAAAILLSGCGVCANAEEAESAEKNTVSILTEEISVALSAIDSPGEWMIFDLAKYGAEIPEEKEQEQAWINPFSDVESNAWFITAVQFVSENGFMKGMTNSSFEPNTVLTRAMFVSVLYRMEKEPETNTSAFSDVGKNDWFRRQI